MENFGLVVFWICFFAWPIGIWRVLVYLRLNPMRGKQAFVWFSVRWIALAVGGIGLVVWGGGTLRLLIRVLFFDSSAPNVVMFIVFSILTGYAWQMFLLGRRLTPISEPDEPDEPDESADSETIDAEFVWIEEEEQKEKPSAADVSNRWRPPPVADSALVQADEAVHGDAHRRGNAPKFADSDGDVREEARIAAENSGLAWGAGFGLIAFVLFLVALLVVAGLMQREKSSSKEKEWWERLDDSGKSQRLAAQPSPRPASPSLPYVPAYVANALSKPPPISHSEYVRSTPTPATREPVVALHESPALSAGAGKAEPAKAPPQKKAPVKLDSESIAAALADAHLTIGIKGAQIPDVRGTASDAQVSMLKSEIGNLLKIQPKGATRATLGDVRKVLGGLEVTLVLDYEPALKSSLESYARQWHPIVRKLLGDETVGCWVMVMCIDPDSGLLGSWGCLDRHRRWLGKNIPR